MSLYTTTQLSDTHLGFPVDTEADVNGTLGKLEQLVRDGVLTDPQVDQILYGYADANGLYAGLYNTDPANLGYFVANAEAAPASPTPVYTGAAGATTRYYAAQWAYPLVPGPGNAGAAAGKYLNWLPGKKAGGRPSSSAQLAGNESDQRDTFAGLPSISVTATGNVTVADDGTIPAAGDTFTATINGTSVTYTVVSGDTTLLIIATHFAAAINANATVSPLLYAVASSGTPGQVNLSARQSGSAGFLSLAVSKVSTHGTIAKSGTALTLAVGPASVASTAAVLGGGNFVTVTAPAYSGLGTGVKVDIFAADVNGTPLYYVGRAASGGTVIDYGNQGQAQYAGGGFAGGNRLLPPCEVCVGTTSGVLIYGSKVSTRQAGF